MGVQWCRLRGRKGDFVHFNGDDAANYQLSVAPHRLGGEQVSWLSNLFRKHDRPARGSSTHVREEVAPTISIGGRWEVTIPELSAAAQRGCRHSLAFFGPVDENDVIDPWERSTARNSPLGKVGVPVFGTRSRAFLPHGRYGGNQSLAPGWRGCAAEYILAEEMENWGDFGDAEVEFAVAALPAAIASHMGNGEGIFIWLQFKLRRTDSCFVFPFLITNAEDHAWLQFLSYSKRLSLRNGPKGDGTLNAWVTFNDDALNFLRSKIEPLLPSEPRDGPSS
jgi:hypothetical protein